MSLMTRTTISLPDPLLQTAKRTAAQRGVTLSVVVEDALRIHLAQADSPPARPPFRLITVAGRLVNPHTDLNRTSELLTVDDEEQFSPRRS